MRSSLLLSCGALLVLALTACQPAPTPHVTLEQRLRNPIFAERYWGELVDRMVSLQMNDQKLLQYKTRAAIVDKIRLDALGREQDYTRKRHEAVIGNFVSIGEQVQGPAMLAGNALSLGPGFETDPGPSLHVYLTTVMDPRDVPFPDATSVDLGRLESPYDSQQYDVPLPPKPSGSGSAVPPHYRTVVLWDSQLQLLYGFAQLSKG
ncbi:DM13 domain-containing protein [Candidatus Peregrinibacteria bacterium]|nr:DM13 domain-containing protein [Candidatus Peregrinibacteria bacterium]MBI3816302.1 DM13 domain-containing protein [Candidatus Peregrinibacteria bacterium]